MERPTFSHLLTVRASVSMLFESRHDNPLNSPLFKHLFASFLELNPPKHRQVEPWDPIPVLQYLSTLHLTKLDFMTLSMKTATLVALATGACQSEIHGIHLDHIQ